MIEIFPQNVYEKLYLGFDNDKLKNFKTSIELIKKGNTEGRIVSNGEFGWQSKNLPQSGSFELLTKKITKAGFDFCSALKNFRFTKIEMANLWANINYPGDINWPHIHEGDISGVYYVEVHKNSGNLILKSFSYNLNNKISNYLSGKHDVVIEPKNDMLVLFDANCWHAVSKNNSKKPRISISFNLKIYD
jgi:uncharacterized protein (TIGR02466 family)